jgi:tetratricopeptide (TPR) repeat protein
MKMFLAAVVAALVAAVSICAQPCVDSARQLRPQIDETASKTNVARLAEAREAYRLSPANADAIIWLGRRTAYLGEYKEAIRIFSEGIRSHPGDARMYRHRGHRYITLRCFDDAIEDFEYASKLIKGKPDEVEPDGLPNVKNIPTSTLQSNIWYHLGLAYYLKGDFKKALHAYKEAQKVSKNNDMRVAATYWHYMTLRRIGNAAEAKAILEPFAGAIEVIENTDYLKLIRLNRDEARAEDLLATVRGDANSLGSASLGYGIGNYFLYNGEKERAMAIFRQIVEGNQWSSFGYIAAEAELARTHF